MADARSMPSPAASTSASNPTQVTLPAPERSFASVSGAIEIARAVLNQTAIAVSPSRSSARRSASSIRLSA